jgi:hypothetical protein
MGTHLTGRRRGSNCRAFVALVLIVCVGCTPGAPTDPSAPAAAEPATSLATASPEFPSAGPLASADPEVVAQLVDEQGLTEAEALFAGLTRVEVEQVSPLQYRLALSFPTLNTAIWTVTLIPDQTGDPDAPESVSASYADSEDGFSFRVEYFVPYAELPDDVEREIRGASAGRGHLVAFAGIGALPPDLTASDESGVKVVAEGIVQEMQQNGIAEFLKTLDSALGAGARLERMYDALKAGLAVKDAWALKSELETLNKRLDALEDCARNPTNPVTKRAYQEDPAQLQRVLDEIADARVHVKSNVAMMFVGMISSTGGGLGGPVGSALGYVLGPAASYLKQELTKLNEQRLRELDELIPDCSYKMRLELIGILPASALGGLDGQVTLDGLAEIPLTVGDDGRVTGSGPMDALFAANYNFDDDIVCEGNGETRLTIDVEGNVADELLHVKTTWSGPALSGSVTCRAPDFSLSQPLSTSPWGGDMGALTSGFDIRLADGESITHTVPNPLWDITVIVTIVRGE